MKVVGHLLIACVVLAAIKAAIVALIVTCGLAGVVSLIQKPRETLSALAVLAATAAFVAHPGVIVTVIAAIIVAVHPKENFRCSSIQRRQRNQREPCVSKNAGMVPIRPISETEYLTELSQL